ncbi:MAG: ABC transporter ATP-binding protein [Candidatus Accumulibacter delftensis]|jgi:iron complex transport system ATP-binding protein
MTHRTPLLSTRGLNVGLAGRTFCRQLTLTVQSGECLAILGRNGAGKSTLLSVLAGLRPPDAGEVLVNGASYGSLGARASALARGWLPQSRSEAFSSTVIETALVGRHPHLARWDWESEKDARIARQALAAVGLAELAQRDIQTLSGGERQRLAMPRCWLRRRSSTCSMNPWLTSTSITRLPRSNFFQHSPVSERSPA